MVQLSGGCYDARALTGDVVQAAARVLNVATGDDGAVVVGDVACQLHVAACGDAPGVAGNDPVFSSGLHAVFKHSHRRSARICYTCDESLFEPVRQLCRRFLRTLYNSLIRLRYCFACFY